MVTLFAALADHLARLGRPFVRLALGAMIGTAVIDIVENHHILTLLAVAETGRPIDDGAIVFQATLSATKASFSYLALVLFGVAIPRDTRLGIVLAVFFIAGTLVSGVLGYAAPPPGGSRSTQGEGSCSSWTFCSWWPGYVQLRSCPLRPHARPDS
jgi:hypothetical protein